MQFPPTLQMPHKSHAAFVLGVCVHVPSPSQVSVVHSFPSLHEYVVPATHVPDPLQWSAYVQSCPSLHRVAEFG